MNFAYSEEGRDFRKSRPCVQDDSVYSLQLNIEKALPKNHKGLGRRCLRNYRNIQIVIICRDTGTIWELLEIIELNHSLFRERSFKIYEKN